MGCFGNSVQLLLTLYVFVAEFTTTGAENLFAKTALVMCHSLKIVFGIIISLLLITFQFLYKIPYLRARAWPAATLSSL